MNEPRFPDISIRDIWSFKVTQEEQSVTSASARLGISQAALSRRLQKLEQRLDVSLFDRQAHRLKLTAAGESFADFANQAAGSFEEALGNIKKRARLVDGELRIAASGAPSASIVPDWIQRFLGQHPACSPRVSMSDSDTVINEVIDGSWDVGFVALKPRTELVREYAVAEDEVLLAVPAGHRFSGRVEVELHELAGESFIGRSSLAATNQLVEEVLTQRELTLPPVKNVITIDSGPVISTALERGLGLAWLSLYTIRRSRVVGLQEVRLRGIEFRRYLYMIHAKRSLPPVADTFVRWLLDDIGGTPLPSLPKTHPASTRPRPTRRRKSRQAV